MILLQGMGMKFWGTVTWGARRTVSWSSWDIARRLLEALARTSAILGDRRASRAFTYSVSPRLMAAGVVGTSRLGSQAGSVHYELWAPGHHNSSAAQRS